MPKFDPNKEAAFRFNEEDLNLFNTLKARDIKRLSYKHSDSELSIMAIIQAYRAENLKLKKERKMLTLGMRYFWVWGLIVVLAGVLSGFYMPDAWVSKPVFGALLVSTLTSLFVWGEVAKNILQSDEEEGEEGQELHRQPFHIISRKISSSEEDIVLAKFKPGDEATGKWVTLQDIRGALPKAFGSKTLSALLSHLGFKKKSSNIGTKFLVKTQKQPIEP